MSVRIGGVDGSWVGFAKDVLEVLSPAPYAPGAPIALEVDGTPLQGKSLGSKRQADGRFLVRMRLINLRREHRAMLAAR